MEEQISNTFHCLYCQISHLSELRAEEHIIPKALFNKNYILTDTCRKVNNYMAHSFEKRVLQLEPIKELLLLFGPPANPVHRGQVNTSFDKEVHRYILPSGKDELVEHPKYSSIDSIGIPITIESGEILMYNLKLPFSVVNEMTSIPRMAENRSKYYEREKSLISGYLKDISENPGLDKNFEGYLKKVKGKFTFKGINVIEEKREGIETQLKEAPTQTFQMDLEILFKLFLKIAWGHGAKCFDLSWPTSHLARWIISYLSSGSIDDKELLNKYPHLFTESVSIEKENYSFWKFDMSESFSIIQKIPDRKHKKKLIDLHNLRFNQFRLASQLISYTDRVGIDETYRLQKDIMRYHELIITNMVVHNKEVAVCIIRLFGEVFEVVVQIANDAIAIEKESVFKIEF